MWDAYFLYDRGAAWGDQPVIWGYTLMRSRSALRRDLDQLGVRWAGLRRGSRTAAPSSPSCGAVVVQAVSESRK